MIRFHFKTRRIFASILSLTYFSVQCALANSAEANYWAERKRQTAKYNAESAVENPRTLLASLPATTPVRPELSAFTDGGIQSLSQIALPRDTAASLKNAPHGPFLRGLPSVLTSLPSAWADIRSVSLAPGTKRPLVVLIQDAHGLRDAQMNIARTLEHLSAAAGKLPLIALEGAAGPFSLEPHRQNIAPDIRRAAGDYLLRSGHISGPDYFGLLAERTPRLWGAEDPELYAANVQAYRRTLPLKKHLADFIAALDGRMAPLKNRIYSPELSALDKAMEAYERGALDFIGYVQALQKAAGDGALSGGHFPQTARILKTLAVEQSLDFKRVEAERTEIIAALSAKLDASDLADLAQHSLAYRAGQIGYATFYNRLLALTARKGVPLSGFPEFQRYIAYILMTDEIDRAALFDELDGLRKTAARALCRTAEQRALMDAARDAGLLRRLMDQAFGPAEWDDYLSRRGDILGIEARIGKLAGNKSEPSVELKPLLSPFEDFYSVAQRRNDAMVENLLGKMSGGPSDVAVLVAGGFHSPGLVRILNEKGISCATLMPKIGAVDKGSNYLDVFALNRTPLEKLLLGEKLFLSPPHPFALRVPAALSPITNRVEALYAALTEALRGRGEGAADYRDGGIIRRMTVRLTKTSQTDTDKDIVQTVEGPSNVNVEARGNIFHALWNRFMSAMRGIFSFRRRTPVSATTEPENTQPPAGQPFPLASLKTLSPADMEDKELMWKFFLFKLGDWPVVSSWADETADLIRTRIGDSPDWVLAYHTTHPPHATQQLSRVVGEKIGIPSAELHRRSWLIGYPELGLEARHSVIPHMTMVPVPEQIRGKRVILFDDNLESGANMQEMVRAVTEAGAQEVLAVTLLDSRRAFGFEREMYRLVLSDGLTFDRFIEVITKMRGTISQSGIKFLVRLLSERPDLFNKLMAGIDRNTQMQLLRRTLVYMSIADENKKAATTHLILSLLAKHVYEDLPWAGRKATLQQLKALTGRGMVASRGESDVLFVDSREWVSPTVATAYAHLAGYDYVVFKNRRTISKSAMNEAYLAGQIFWVSVASPYATALPRNVYAADENEPDGTFRLTDIQADLDELSLRLTESRRILKNALEFEDDKENYSRHAAQHLTEVRAIFREACDLVLRRLQREGVLIRDDDVAIAWAGSLARGTPTLQSDLEFDFITASEQTAAIVEDRFGPELVEALRYVGLDLGPSDKLYAEHLKTRYQLKVTGGDASLFDPRMKEEDRPRTLMRLLDYSFAWGNADIYSRYNRQALKEILADHYAVVQIITRIADDFASIASRGFGRKSRNFLIVLDVNRGVVFDMKWLTRGIEAAVKEVVVRRLGDLAQRDPDFSPGNIPRDFEELIDFAVTNKLFPLMPDRETSDGVKRAWRSLIDARLVKSAISGLSSASVLDAQLLRSLSVLNDFTYNYVLLQRSEDRARIMDALEFIHSHADDFTRMTETIISMKNSNRNIVEPEIHSLFRGSGYSGMMSEGWTYDYAIRIGSGLGRRTYAVYRSGNARFAARLVESGHSDEASPLLSLPAADGLVLEIIPFDQMVVLWTKYKARHFSDYIDTYSETPFINSLLDNTILSWKGRLLIVEKILGIGSEAVTYKVRDIMNNKSYALKVGRVRLDAVYIYWKSAMGSMRDWEESGRVLPSMVRFIDYDEKSNSILMEYYENSRAFQERFLNALPLDGQGTSDAIEVLLNISGAVAVMHKHGRSMGDVAPGNILIREDDIDSRIIDPSLNYSPDIDFFKKDLFGLGLLLYQIVVQTPLTHWQVRDFRKSVEAGRPDAELARQIFSHTPAPGIPERLHRIALRACFATAEPYPSAAEFWEDFASAWQETPFSPPHSAVRPTAGFEINMEGQIIGLGRFDDGSTYFYNRNPEGLVTPIDPEAVGAMLLAVLDENDDNIISLKEFLAILLPIVPSNWDDLTISLYRDVLTDTFGFVDANANLSIEAHEIQSLDLEQLEGLFRLIIRGLKLPIQTAVDGRGLGATVPVKVNPGAPLTHRQVANFFTPRDSVQSAPLDDQPDAKKSPPNLPLFLLVPLGLETNWMDFSSASDFSPAIAPWPSGILILLAAAAGAYILYRVIKAVGRRYKNRAVKTGRRDAGTEQSQGAALLVDETLLPEAQPALRLLFQNPLALKAALEGAQEPSWMDGADRSALGRLRKKLAGLGSRTERVEYLLGNTGAGVSPVENLLETVDAQAAAGGVVVPLPTDSSLDIGRMLDALAARAPSADAAIVVPDIPTYVKISLQLALRRASGENRLAGVRVAVKKGVFKKQSGWYEFDLKAARAAGVPISAGTKLIVPPDVDLVNEDDIAGLIVLAVDRLLRGRAMEVLDLKAFHEIARIIETSA